MKGYLLDTDVLIDWLRGHDPTVIWIMRQANSGVVLSVSGVSVTEILSCTAPDRHDARVPLLAAFEYAPLTFAAAELAGRLRRNHRKSGTTIPLAYLLQAAIALTEDLEAATANTKHFPDVVTINPRRLR